MPMIQSQIQIRIKLSINRFMWFSVLRFFFVLDKHVQRIDQFLKSCIQMFRFKSSKKKRLEKRRSHHSHLREAVNSIIMKKISSTTTTSSESSSDEYEPADFHSIVATTPSFCCLQNSFHSIGYNDDAFNNCHMDEDNSSNSKPIYVGERQYVHHSSDI